MKNKEMSLSEISEKFIEIIKPYQQENNKRQKKIDFIRKCIRCMERDNFFEIDEMLKTKIVNDIGLEEELQSCLSLFKHLKNDANKKVELYRVQFVEDLQNFALESDLPIEVDFPNFSILKGIEGTIEFSTRKTIINKKILKTIDPKRVILAALKLKRQLYDNKFDPVDFIDKMFEVYSRMLGKEKKQIGHTLPIRDFYLEFVLSNQSNTFFQDMDKGKFRGYSLDQFAVDIWKFFQSASGGRKKGYMLKLSSGRSRKSLWLIDSDGEKRQISTISFHGGK